MTKKRIRGKPEVTMMGVETPMPMVAMDAASPDGAPPRRIRTAWDNFVQRLGSNRLAPPCLGKALRRGAFVGFPSSEHCSNPARFMSISPERKQQQNGARI